VENFDTDSNEDCSFTVQSFVDLVYYSGLKLYSEFYQSFKSILSENRAFDLMGCLWIS
jgi:hypothetical protein